MRRFVAILCFLLLSVACLAQKQHRVLIVLDASAQMQEKLLLGISKFALAQKFIDRFIDSIHSRNKDVQIGLRVFGGQPSADESNCNNTRTEVVFGANSFEQLHSRLSEIKPSGKAPVVYAMNEAIEKDAVNTEKIIYHIVLITGSNNTCDSNIGQLVNKMAKRQIPPACIVGIDDGNLNGLYKYNNIGTYRIINNEMAIKRIINEMRNECCKLPLLLKQSNNNATKEEKKDGYLKIIDNNTTRSYAMLYRITKNEFVFYKRVYGDSLSKRIKLPAGKYRLEYGDHKTTIIKEVTVVGNMIAEISL